MRECVHPYVRVSVCLFVTSCVLLLFTLMTKLLCFSFGYLALQELHADLMSMKFLQARIAKTMRFSWKKVSSFPTLNLWPRAAGRLTCSRS